MRLDLRARSLGEENVRKARVLRVRGARPTPVCQRDSRRRVLERRSVKGVQCLFKELRQGLARVAAQAAKTGLVVMNVVEKTPGER